MTIRSSVDWLVNHIYKSDKPWLNIFNNEFCQILALKNIYSNPNI
jgi:uncharacterized damage-inducible protein DinB